MIKRAIIISIFFGMFVVGIIVRIACPPPTDDNNDDVGLLTTEVNLNITTDSLRQNFNLTTPQSLI